MPIVPSAALVGREQALSGQPRKAFLRGGAIVATGLVVELGSLFLRTTILARLLGATEFGLVVSINTLAALVAMFSFIGVDRYIVYAPDGGEKGALAVGHALSLVRGVLGALMLLLLAVPTAALIHEQAHVASFAMVAAVPLLSGAQNLGVSQMQRSGRFWPAAAADSGGAVLGVMAATAAALVVPDHRAILWGLAVQTGGAVALSHILARGVPYRVSFDTVRIRETLRFGLPLLINGIALAVAYQLDRMIVGAWLGVVALGVYGLCTTLLLQPVTLLLRLATTTLQPRLSSVWHTDRLGAFRVLARRIGGGICILACGGAVAAACLGAPTLRLIFGASFSASDLFFVVMAAVVLIRMGRGSLNLFGLAIGRTSDLMISNVAGSAALPLMIAILAVSPHLESAVCAGLCGEIVGWLVADLRLRRHCPEACRAVMRGLALSGTLLILVSVWVCTCSPSIAMRVTVAVAALIFIIPGLATQLPERALRTLNAEPR